MRKQKVGLRILEENKGELEKMEKKYILKI